LCCARKTLTHGRTDPSKQDSLAAKQDDTKVALFDTTA